MWQGRGRAGSLGGEDVGRERGGVHGSFVSPGFGAGGAEGGRGGGLARSPLLGSPWMRGSDSSSGSGGVNGPATQVMSAHSKFGFACDAWRVGGCVGGLDWCRGVGGLVCRLVYWLVVTTFDLVRVCEVCHSFRCACYKARGPIPPRLSVSMSLCLSIRLSAHLSIRPCVSVCLSRCLPCTATMSRPMMALGLNPYRKTRGQGICVPFSKFGRWPRKMSKDELLKPFRNFCFPVGSCLGGPWHASTGSRPV